MKIINNNLFTLLGLVLMGWGLSGCPKAKGPVSETPPVETPAEEAAASEETMAPAAPMVDLGTDYATAPDFLDPVYFEYMRAELTESARAGLKKNAGILKEILKAQPSVKIRVEGHCDDRGTLEYNLALGERRAMALRGYYATLGVPKTALSTISYGEERPVCTRADEDCWSNNRRGETTLKASKAVQVPLSR